MRVPETRTSGFDPVTATVFSTRIRRPEITQNPSPPLFGALHSGELSVLIAADSRTSSVGSDAKHGLTRPFGAWIQTSCEPGVSTPASPGFGSSPTQTPL